MASSSFVPDDSVDHNESPSSYTMETSAKPLRWAAKFEVAPSNGNLPGDKVVLPSSVLEQLISANASASTAQRGPETGRQPFNSYNQLESLQRTQSEQLPHPLTFRLSNPENDRIVYAGVREFAAEEGQACLSGFLLRALGLEPPVPSALTNGVKSTLDGDVPMANDGLEGRASQVVTISAASLPKGTYVKLRPMQAGYDTEDWKALLEEHLRNRYTTLTKGEILNVPSGPLTGGKGDDFELLVDEVQPEGEAICVIDTDLTCDVEALNEEQARETLKQIAERKFKRPGTSSGSSTGGALSLFRGQDAQVLPADYVDYELPAWDRSQGIEFSLETKNGAGDLDLLFSPFGTRQRSRPRMEEHALGDFESRPAKRLRLSPTNVELENADALWVSVHASPTKGDPSAAVPIPYSIRASVYDAKSTVPDEKIATQDELAPLGPDQVRCTNCKAAVPQRSLILHENFCLRNNILCPQGCGQVFQRRSAVYQNHWHCPHDSSHGFSLASKEKHDDIYHTSHACPVESCSNLPQFDNLPALASHRTTTCPSKLILCRFCHLTVPQGAPTSDTSFFLTDLTPHETADGNRTENCHLCAKLIRLKDMATHMRHHDLERRSRPRPRTCRNVLCGRTLDKSHRAETYINSGASNDIGLCSICFGPLYAATFDPDGKALRRRIERRYLTQMTGGCKNGWCKNEYCKTSRERLGVEVLNIKATLPLVKPFVDATQDDLKRPLHFCTSEENQKARVLAEMLAAEGAADGVTGGKEGGHLPGAKVYSLPWCVAALEAKKGDLDNARSWLRDMAPTRDEEK
ncbi:MAG: hypothetical protein M1828_006147 [Chrysothrix sp. TS-e1954]|nr:MAG: hypothetical protein M1828_006147 [Chrysothrix sp. TS-e1954]